MVCLTRSSRCGPRFVLPTGEAGLRFDSVWVPPGSPFESGSLVSTVYSDSVVLHFDGPLRATGTGLLLHALYETTEASDTVSGRMYLHATSSGSGCVRFISDSAAYMLLPVGPSVSLAALTVPEFVWDQSVQRYQPPIAETAISRREPGVRCGRATGIHAPWLRKGAESAQSGIEHAAGRRDTYRGWERTILQLAGGTHAPPANGYAATGARRGVRETARERWWNRRLSSIPPSRTLAALSRYRMCSLILRGGNSNAADVGHRSQLWWCGE
jgi:hypothetical protein